MKPGRELPPPGRDLDALVAQKIMGWTRKGRILVPPGIGWPKDRADISQEVFPIPRYSLEISAAWEVLQKVWNFEITSMQRGNPPVYYVDLLLNASDTSKARLGWVQAHADTLPHAICVAALKAVGVTIEGETK